MREATEPPESNPNGKKDNSMNEEHTTKHSGSLLGGLSVREDEKPKNWHLSWMWTLDNGGHFAVEILGRWTKEEAKEIKRLMPIIVNVIEVASEKEGK